MNNPIPDKIDVALSGGGIRSATFALGMLQTLAQHQLLGKIKTLSTVSGGGYVGSFLCRLAAQVRALSPQASTAETWEKTGQILLTPTSQDVRLAPQGEWVFHPLQWLRENSRYLTPSGSDDLISGLAYYLRGLLGLHFNLAVLLVLLGLINAASGVVGDLVWNSVVDKEPTVRQWLVQASAAPAGQCVVEIRLQPAPAPCSWWVPSGWWLAVLLMLWGALATGVAYWLTVRPTRAKEVRGSEESAGWRGQITSLKKLTRLEKREAWMGWLAGLALLFTFSFWAWRAHGVSAVQFALALALAAVCGAAAVVNGWAGRAKATPANDTRTALEIAQARTDVQRRRLTVWLSQTLKAAAVVAVLALVDTLAMSLVQYRALHGSWLPWSLPAAVYGAVLAAAWKWLKQAEPVDGKPPRFAGLTQLALLLLAVAVVLGLALIYQVLAYELALGQQLAGASLRDPFALDWPITAAFAGGLVLVAVCVQYTPGFLNLSSFHNLYTARLKRAYLGAANQTRLIALARTSTVDEAGRGKVFVSEVMPGDEPKSMEVYLEDNHKLGIEHVVNVTLNQRRSATSPTLAQDRQGLPVCLTAQGLWVNPPQSGAAQPLFDLEQMKQSPLSLGQWMSISGAAFSVGVGKETKPGYALLAFLANVRTAYWWRKPVTDKETGHGKGTWNYLWEEARCRFKGTSGRYWYLSDGGHFDNTGVYELIRRKVPVVLASDNGADPCYQFDDLMHLVRRVRIDFGTEAVIRSASEMGGLTGFGTPEEFRAARDKRGAMPYALWLELYYDRESPETGRPRDTATDAPDSVVIFIKPALPDGLPGDVGHYARTHPAFPQETTADQFFDEAQWESYRALGQALSARLLAQNLFGAVAARRAGRL